MNFKIKNGQRPDWTPGERTHVLAEVEMHRDGTGTIHSLDGHTVMASGPSVESVPEGMTANQVPYDGGPRREFRMPQPGEKTAFVKRYEARMREGNYQETENT